MTTKAKVSLTPQERGRIRAIKNVMKDVDYASYSATAIAYLLGIIERLTKKETAR